MKDTAVSGTPDADQAKALLDRAHYLGAGVRSGAGWPAISFLLGLGAVSSMGIIALTYVDRIPGAQPILPTIFMLAWILILLTTFVRYNRTLKRGFSTRWSTYLLLWGVVWAVGVGFSGSVFEGQLWFAGLVAALLTIVTTSCAWYEARR